MAKEKEVKPTTEDVPQTEVVEIKPDVASGGQ